MYESPHPPPVAKASDAPAHFLGIDWNGIDWTSWAVAIATIAIVAFIVLKGRNRPRRSGSPAGDGTDLTDAALTQRYFLGTGPSLAHGKRCWSSRRLLRWRRR